MLAEAKEIPIFSRFKQMGRNYYVQMIYVKQTSSSPVAGRIITLVNNPRRLKNEQQLVSGCYKEVTPLGRIILLKLHKRKPLLRGQISFEEESQIKEAGIKIIHERIRTSKYFATNCSEMESTSFMGYALIDVRASGGVSWKYGIGKIASTFSAEALGIGETLEIIEKIYSEQNFMIFSGSQSVLKGISNTSPMNSTSHYSNA
jgi:hypothetical protein